MGKGTQILIKEGKTHHNHLLAVKYSKKHLRKNTMVNSLALLAEIINSNRKFGTANAKHASKLMPD